MSKAPSPLTAPIRRLRALGASVSYTDRHNPSSAALRPTISLRVIPRPGARPREITRPGHRYCEVVERLTAIADDIENGGRPA